MKPREWKLRRPPHFNPWSVSQLEIFDGPIIEEPFTEYVLVIEAAPVLAEIERLKSILAFIPEEVKNEAQRASWAYGPKGLAGGKDL